ncbi:MAG: hypothetical protein FD123_1815 [Bacteroidetes bacterium]|nr:MAG: hypothetical protein FD123_1815 [Bacteroidota bacterium]
MEKAEPLIKKQETISDNNLSPETDVADNPTKESSTGTDLKESAIDQTITGQVFGNSSDSKKLDFSFITPVSKDQEDPGPYLRYEIDLQTGEMHVDKFWEYRSGDMSIQVWVKRSGKSSSQSSKYYTNDGTDLGDMVLTATEEKVLKDAYSSKLVPDMKRQVTLESQNVSTGLKIKPEKCTYAFEKPDKMYNSRQYFEEVGLPFYLKMRKAEDISINGNVIQKKVWDVKGAVFALCLSAAETGYANKSNFDTAKKSGNYWGVGGASNFQTLGSNFDDSYNYWIDYMTYGYLNNKKVRDGKGFGGAISLFESGNFTADKINKELRSGRHKPSATDLHAGYYPYNTDAREANDKYYKDETKKELAEYKNYAGEIMDSDMMKMIIARFVVFLDEKIANPTFPFNDPYAAKATNEYNAGLYETIKCELADFMQNDYPGLLSTKDNYDAK